VSNTLEQVRARCRRKARALLEIRKKCHMGSEHHSDVCGYFRDKYCYLLVDCRTVKGMPLCWVSILDHYTHEVLLSEPCASTPEAARYGRAFFTKKGPPK
jgi:hypothetical protein